MSIEQKSYFCPVCKQQRLFTGQGINHTPHILATVFLCGLWLPIWLLTAATYNPRFHCSQCGFSDSTKYLANPNLREREKTAASQSQLDAFTYWFSNLDMTKTAMVFAAIVISIIIIVVVQSNVKNKQESIVPFPVATTPTPLVNSKGFLLLEDVKYSLERQSKFTDKDYYDVYQKLIQIPTDAPEQKEAQQILSKYKKQIDKAKQKFQS